MKYDDFEKVECRDYPNENISVQMGKKKKSLLEGKNTMDLALSGVLFATSFALVLLFTSVISLAVSGNLATTIMSIFS